MMKIVQAALAFNITAIGYGVLNNYRSQFESKKKPIYDHDTFSNNLVEFNNSEENKKYENKYQNMMKNLSVYGIRINPNLC